MNEEKFTQGEWRVTNMWIEGNPPETYGIAFAVICRPDDTDYAHLSNDIMQANAALIAAAPVLYKELQRECVICKLKGHETACDFCRIGKVLKKARGEE